MDAFVSQKRKRVEVTQSVAPPQVTPPQRSSTPEQEEESTDIKLALLASLHPAVDEATLLEALLASDGHVDQASASITQSTLASPRKRSANAAIGYQSSLSLYRLNSEGGGPAKKPLVKKGKTLYLFSPEDIEQHTPCSIIHNFLPPQQANALLQQLIDETPTYQRLEFKLFDRVVTSSSTFSFYVNSLAEAEEQKTEYIYDGRKVENVQQSLPEMLRAVPQVEATVNREIERRIRDFYPCSKKLKYQSPHPWKANTAFVNCYDGPQEHVGYHADQLTYLGPRAVIGSLSLGVAREFRVRRIHAEDDKYRKDDGSLADAQGQISIHLPHNSLLVMHAEMQEEWKHSIAPAQAIDPHPLAKNKRLNITYRFYKDSLHPRYTPECRCGVPTVLRCATRKKKSRGRYMWMCHTNYVPGQDGCSFFQWAEFDDDGEPPWAARARADQEKLAKDRQSPPNDGSAENT
ncbi:oxidoreductase [Ascochyta rabiei]|uniref:Oxidoreductase n=1 Tax=Didymella rabiei TaxID=5454 RepID=A0A163HIA0_DIDRA|nr:oxidoreductase [Ascochyta rabiei]